MGVDKEEPRSHLDLMSCGIRKTLPQPLGVRPGQDGCAACQGPGGREWVNTVQKQQAWERRLNEALGETFQERVLKPRGGGGSRCSRKPNVDLGAALQGGSQGCSQPLFPLFFWGEEGVKGVR